MPTIQLVGREANDPAPDLMLFATDAQLRPFFASRADDEGRFDLPEEVLAKAALIAIDTADDKGAHLSRTRSVLYRPDQLRAILKAGDVIELARSRWTAFLPLFRRCVTGRVRRCSWWPWWQQLVALPRIPDRVRFSTTPVEPVATRAALATSAVPTRSATAARLTSSLRATALASSSLSLGFRCAAVCEGIVEVYQRLCCWEPIVIFDPRIPEIIDILDDLPQPIPDPFPNPPGPPPFESIPVFAGGTIRTAALNARHDAATLRSLAPAEQAAFIEARPYLRHLLSCGTATKVGQGFLQPGGTFQVCWSQFPFLTRANCHFEVAYVVKQLINGVTVTIYDGRAAGQWFALEEEPTLTSYHPQAVGCREGEDPRVEGAAIYLDAIGGADAYRLKTPAAAAWDRVAAPDYNDGLCDPVAAPADAEGALLNRNWGGTLNLRWWFTEPCRAAGAMFYRASIVPADATGAPQAGGTRHFLAPPGGAWQKLVFSGGGFDLVSVPLGVPPVGGEGDLYRIPYDADLPATEEWRDGQFHAVLPTNAYAEGRWLLTLEVFDAAGNRLRPAGGSGPGNDAPFVFKRWEAPGTPDVFTDVPFAGLTHMFWWDNRAGTGDILGLRVNGAATTGECQFLSGLGMAQLAVDFIAHHPVAAFQLSHGLTWYRGINGTSGAIPVLAPFTNEGTPPATAATSVPVSFASMLGPHTKCSFALHLTMGLKTFDGNASVFPNTVREVAAFALEATGP